MAGALLPAAFRPVGLTATRRAPSSNDSGAPAETGASSAHALSRAERPLNVRRNHARSRVPQPTFLKPETPPGAVALGWRQGGDARGERARAQPETLAA